MIYVSAGGGHRSAAMALAKAFQTTISSYDIKVIDALDYTNPTYKKMYVSAYLNMVKHMPELWGYIYKKYDSRKVSSNIENLRKSLDKFNARDLLNFISEYQPDVIIGTHFLPLQIVSHLKKQKGTKPLLVGVVTDFGAHSLWMQNNVDSYFVPTTEVKRELNRFGQPIEKISVTGIPVDSSFNDKGNKDQIKSKLGLAKDRATLLLLSGGYGVGPVKEFISSFKNSSLPIQILAVAGKNNKLMKEIKTISRGIPVKAFGFVTNLDELMEASDFIATKPGGLTSSEILVKRKPMIILDPIPGQEQRNCEYLLEQGVAIRLFDPADAPYKIKELLADKQRILKMRRNATKIARPDAARNIVKEVKSYLSHV